MSDLILGLTLGAAAGITPGPLFALVVTTGLQRGFGAGARTALAPLLSDVPVVAVALAAVASLPDTTVVWLGRFGGVYLIWLGVETVREAAAGPGSADDRFRDLGRGVVANLLSPHPWLFWFAVGAPATVSAWGRSPGSAVAFVAGFYLLLVGSKVAVAFFAASGRRILTEAARVRFAQVGGGVIVVMGILLLVEYLR